MQRMLIVATVVFGLTSAAHAQGTLTGIQVYPPEVNLNTKVDLQRYIVVASRSDGVTLDVTSLAQAKLADGTFARLDKHALYPVADGQTTLDIEYQGFKAAIPVTVKDATADRAISFKLDVMPIFMRSGCNTGSCHGAARGKDGFMLSLFGYDPDGDHRRLTREIGFRRINLAVPKDSLLIEKSIGSVPHTGGKRFEEASEYNQTLLRWLEAGAPADATEPAAIVGVDLYPPNAVVESEGQQQFIARARYSDGSDRDITSLAVFQTSNDNSASMTPDGLVKGAARGEAFVMARFETHTVGSQVLVLPKDLMYTPPPITGNYIDQLVGAKLNKLRILPSEICTDEEFLRRATIDITGTLPTEEEFAVFMADASADKRAKLVDRLLERKEFAEIWAMKWSELLMVKSSNQVSYKSMYLYSTWLTDKIASNAPLNQTVTELLSASGGTFKEPATNFYQIERDTLKTAENVAQVFMGIRTQCAQCHNHPFDRWTQNDYYSFAAFFSQIGRKEGEDYRETIIFNSGGGEVSHPLTKKQMAPKFLGGIQPELQPGQDRREVLAKWISSTDNPFFATSVANRVWAHFFGKGIVEPVDDIRVSNPPSNPELFKALGDHLVQYNYDFKQMVRDICNSQAYQRSTVRNESNETDERNFAHGNVRRIAAEQLLDCICQVTGAQEKFRGLPLGARAVQVADGRTSNYFLTTFGRSGRETVCACEAKTEPTLSQALHMLNGTTIGGKITQGALVQKALKEGKTPEQAIEAIYVRALSRHPTAEELNRLTTVVKESPTPEAGVIDVFWAVLNSREFLFNH